MLNRHDQNFVTADPIDDAVWEAVREKSSRISRTRRSGVRLFQDAQDSLVQLFNKLSAETQFSRFVECGSVGCVKFCGNKIPVSQFFLGNFSRNRASTSSPGTA